MLKVIGRLLHLDKAQIVNSFKSGGTHFELQKRSRLILSDIENRPLFLKVMYTIVFVMFLVYLSFMKENKYFVQK